MVSEKLPVWWLWHTKRAPQWAEEALCPLLSLQALCPLQRWLT